MDIGKWKEMFDINVHGLFYMTKISIPGMKNLKEGHIVNVASIAGTMGSENLSGYCGTKFAVRGISQSLFKELRNDGIKVSCVMPGSVQTGFFHSMKDLKPADNMLSPADVAATIVHLLQSPENCLHSEVELRPLIPKGKK